MLSSECPGWVCYLEKVLGEKFVKYASPVKTPQLVAASLLRRVLANSEESLSEEEIFIGLIAPCFDKKLEAAREEGKKEKKIIDLVLGTNEIAKFLESKIENIGKFFLGKVRNSTHFVDFRDCLKDAQFKSLSVGLQGVERFKKSLGEFEIRTSSSDWGSSNGYIDFILRNTEDIKDVAYKTVKNQNFVEVKVTFNNPEKSPLFMAYIYGFKNIQNLIRRIKVSDCYILLNLFESYSFTI